MEKKFVARLASLSVILLVIGACTLLVGALAGCSGSAYERVDGGRNEVTQRTSEPVLTPDGQPVYDKVGHLLTKTSEFVGKAVAAGAQANGSKISSTFQSELPEFKIPGGGGSNGGKSTNTATILGAIPVIPILFGVASLVSLLGGIYFVRLGHLSNALACFAVGICCGTIAVYPFLLPLAGIALLLALGYWVYANRDKFRSFESARASTAALKDAMGGSADTLMKKASTLPSDLAVYHEIVRKDNL